MPEGRLAGKKACGLLVVKMKSYPKIIWISRYLDHKRAGSGQNEELSKKRFGLLAILTTKGLFLVKTRSNPKKELEKSLS
ncbi:MAG: hypothetical protein QM270_07230 [Bacillota bacterium]|nr:hypothetical protein [Bacillota bacterium]